MKTQLNKPIPNVSFLNIAMKSTLFLLIVLISFSFRGIQLPEKFIFIADTLPEGNMNFQLQNRILLILFLLISFLILGKKYKRLFSVSPLKYKGTYFWIFGLIAFVILILHRPVSFQMINLHLGHYIQLFIIVCILVPIEEELFYRGLLLLIPYRKLKYLMLIISSLLFAFTHTAVFSTLLLGLALGILALRFRNILVPILAHSLWNLFSIFF